MADMLAPTCEADVADAVADAMRAGQKLAITGGGSKSAIGTSTASTALIMTGLAGVIDYDPAELVLTVKPGTPLATVEQLVSEAGQMLAFGPFDHGPIFGQPIGSATIGGVVAAGVAGSHRLSGLGTRDHLLGFRAVSGRGEAFAAGAKVVKNVTGYDLPKLAAGSWGRLFAMTELTLKVMPRPVASAYLALHGLDNHQAIHALSLAMGSQANVAAAAHVPADIFDGESVTLLHIQGFASSVAARCQMLESLLSDYGMLRRMTDQEGQACWDDLRTLSPLGASSPLWRINIAPRRAADLIASMHGLAARCLFDWAGGLIWMVSEAEATIIRNAVSAEGGHATLIRAAASIRASIPAFHPQPAGITALEERVRRAFDPFGVFETGRFF
jgi:glycolate oxidase FAD binding subunit